MLAAWRGRLGKLPLGRAPRPALPPHLLHRRKTGFTLPLQRWVGSDHERGRALELPGWLLSAGATAAVARIFDGVASGRVHWSRAWSLIVLERLLGDVR